MKGAILSTLLAWFVGLFLDANIYFGSDGFLELRILFPVIVMGCFILKRIDKKDK